MMDEILRLLGLCFIALACMVWGIATAPASLALALLSFLLDLAILGTITVIALLALAAALLYAEERHPRARP